MTKSIKSNHTLVPCSTQSPVADDPSSALVPLLFDPKKTKQAQESVVNICKAFESVK